MPVQLPKARTINEYAVITTTDFYDPASPWLRVMFFQGSFTIAQAQSFFRAHRGHQNRWTLNPASYFSEPVEVLMFAIPPEEHLPKLTKTAYAFRFIPTECYCSTYEWGVAQNIINSQYPDAPLNMCTVGHLWWRNLT